VRTTIPGNSAINTQPIVPRTLRAENVDARGGFRDAAVFIAACSLQAESRTPSRIGAFDRCRHRIGAGGVRRLHRLAFAALALFVDQSPFAREVAFTRGIGRSGRSLLHLQSALGFAEYFEQRDPARANRIAASAFRAVQQAMRTRYRQAFGFDIVQQLQRRYPHRADINALSAADARQQA